nr:hypothetical protein [Tanacetum cinerariifolium]
MAKLAFCDYHNMVSILEKTEHNTDFHQIVNFLEASHIRYALTISPTVYVSHIRQFWSTARIKTTNQETKILATVNGKPRTIFESSLRRHLKLNDEEGISSLPDVELFENLSLMGYNILPNQIFTFQKGQFSHQWKFLIHTIMQCLSLKSIGFNEFSSNIATDGYTVAQSKALSPAADEPTSLSRDDTQGEAFLTISSLDAGQDRENITKTSALPHDSSPRVTSLDADEGSMQQRIHELMELYTSQQRKKSQMAAKIKYQDLEISGLKARVKSLKDKERRSSEPTQEDAPITRGIMEIGKELGADKSTELGSNDTKKMVNVLSLMEVANILTSGGAAATISPGDVLPTTGVPTVSGSFSTVSAIFTAASVIDARAAREMEKEFARENQRLSKQLARDSEIARIHAEEELKIMIKGLDRNNEVIAKHLREYEQAAADLSVGEKLELISELEIKEKFIPVWKQLEYFVHMSLKQESERVKRQGLKIDQGSAKRVKTSKSVSEDVSVEELKGMMQLVPLEEVYVEALQKLDREDLHQLWTLVKENFSIKQATSDKEKELWVELNRLFETDFEDQLWTHNQAFMHDPLDWKLYDTCGVHHVSTKDQDIFMLVEKDYPLRKGLATVMISNKLQVKQYSQMANDLILKIYNIANSPR